MYLTFREKLEPYFVFSVKDIEKQFPKLQSSNLYRWQAKHYIEKLRQGWYIFSKQVFSEQECFFIANRLYTPSYVSLETTLSYYGVIPEGVFIVRSVSTRKTARFQNKTGIYAYAKVKSSLFFGYQLVSFNNRSYKMAEPEKALLDYLYLNPSIIERNDFESLRWNKEVLRELLDKEKLHSYCFLFRSKTLTHRLTALTTWIYD